MLGMRRRFRGFIFPRKLAAAARLFDVRTSGKKQPLRRYNYVSPNALSVARRPGFAVDGIDRVRPIVLSGLLSGLPPRAQPWAPFPCAISAVPLGGTHFLPP